MHPLLDNPVRDSLDLPASRAQKFAFFFGERNNRAQNAKREAKDFDRIYS